jgi:hypothetical protein
LPQPGDVKDGHAGASAALADRSRADKFAKYSFRAAADWPMNKAEAKLIRTSEDARQNFMTPFAMSDPATISHPASRAAPDSPNAAAARSVVRRMILHAFVIYFFLALLGLGFWTLGDRFWASASFLSAVFWLLLAVFRFELSRGK